MKKMSWVILVAFALVCFTTVVAGLGKHGETAKNLVVSEVVEPEGISYNTTSIFGLWFSPNLDPYKSTDYYLHDNLVPESDSFKKLPFKIYTKAHIYELDSYKPETAEYGYAWLNLKEVDKNGNVLSENPFKYQPSGFAKLRYNAFSQTVELVN